VGIVSTRRLILVRCGIGIVCLVAAAGLRWAMVGVLGHDLPYATFYPFVFLAAITGGWISVAFVALPALLVSSIYQDIHGVLLPDLPLEALFAATSIIAASIGEIYLRKNATLHEMIEYLNKESGRRAAAEEALADEIRLHESAPELAHFGVFRMDIHRDICYWPPFSALLLGKEPGAITMSVKDALALVVDDDRERVTAELNAILQDGITRKTEYAIIRLDGQRRYIKSVGKLTRNKEGNPVVITTMLDITDDRRLHFQIDQREEEYRQLVENQIVGIGLVDANEQILYMNPAGCAMFELMDYHGRKITEFLPPNELPKVESETVKRATGANSSYELEIVTTIGQRRWLLVSAAPRFDATGRFVATFGVFHDISARKEMELQLRDAEEKLRRIARNIPEVFWIIDEQTWAIVYASPAFESVFGIPLGAVQADVRGLLAYVEESDRATVLGSLRGDFTRGNNTVEFRLLRPDGTRSEIRMQNSKMRDESASLNRIAGIVTDITSQKKTKIHLA